jgi:hypothetical protein
VSGDSEPHTSLSHHLATHHEAVSVQLCHTKEESYAQSRGGFFQVHRQRVGARTPHRADCLRRSSNWVKKGSGAFNEKSDKSFYGVGSVVGVRNEPLAWDTAENRSRAEIAKTFETYTAYLMRDYAASTTAGDFSRNSEEQNIERAVKTFSAVTLNGVKPMDRYKDEKSGTYYVLTKLSLEDMKNNLEQAKELNGQVRDFVRKNADRLFDRLEKEEDKRATK